jgi:hypothetical protein
MLVSVEITPMTASSYSSITLSLSYLLVTKRQSSSKSGSQQETTDNYSSTSRMMRVGLISVLFCRSGADWWPGSNWRFSSNPFFIAPNAPIVTSKILVFTFHILLTSISRSLKLNFQRLVWLHQSVGKSLLIYHEVLYQVSLSVVQCMIIGTSHIIVLQ